MNYLANKRCLCRVPLWWDGEDLSCIMNVFSYKQFCHAGKDTFLVMDHAEMTDFFFFNYYYSWFLREKPAKTNWLFCLKLIQTEMTVSKYRSLVPH